ncbi:cupin domain-containing protein [Methanobacterium alcaliphilum]|uniref:cupin domain-containing protein n=1 Tax=Methanobacterium alcaliphilum TaxID=392018 RepID=UPI00200B83EE|nr:cupin domain-containing protein [Methanobacterium alcaliphilum]MCK9151162.1 cupin domain-containing protein [Methanobacterium alcaliphilum]
MKITEVKNASISETPHKVDVRKLYDTENAIAVHITLKPGESLKRHVTPVDVFFYVLEGTGIVEIGDEKEEVVADSLIESPANIMHCWYNESSKDLRFLVIKVPRPIKDTRIV